MLKPLGRKYLFAPAIICKVYLLRAHPNNPEYTKAPALPGWAFAPDPIGGVLYIVPPDSLAGEKWLVGRVLADPSPGSALRA